VSPGWLVTVRIPCLETPSSAYLTLNLTLTDLNLHAGVLEQPKAIHGVSVVLLFRYRGGAAVFDDVSLTPLQIGLCTLPP
jgi:hypothetical protein